MDTSRYLRDDLASFHGYSSAASSAPKKGGERIWLNANESPWNNSVDADGIARRYPHPQPPLLRKALADLVAVAPENVLMGRGSDELIDVIVRSTCRPTRDAILISTPTFGMYGISAQVQALEIVDVPLIDVGDDFHYDTEGVLAALKTNPNIKIVFICTPGNPTGTVVKPTDIEQVVTAAHGRALVVVDEAYFEFTHDTTRGALELLEAHENVVVLRTLSKAYALAGARVGYAIADPDLIAAFGRVHAPYPVATPSQKLALAALEPAAQKAGIEMVARMTQQRDHLLSALRNLGLSAYHSATNFVLVRFPDPAAALAALDDVDVVVRDARGYAATPDALRITVGTAEQTQLVIDTLTTLLTDN